jgi:hypothetical protein
MLGARAAGADTNVKLSKAMVVNMDTSRLA